MAYFHDKQYDIYIFCFDKKTRIGAISNGVDCIFTEKSCFCLTSHNVRIHGRGELKTRIHPIQTSSIGRCLEVVLVHSTMVAILRPTSTKEVRSLMSAILPRLAILTFVFLECYRFSVHLHRQQHSTSS